MEKQRIAMVTIIAIVIGSGCGWAATATVVPNDNRRPAGHLADGVLTVDLVAEDGGWRPEGPTSPELRVAAFREEGGSLTTPGPLLRVVEGSTIVARIRNALSAPLALHGFQARPAATDIALWIGAGETRTIRFAAGKPGTYHYWASTAATTLNQRQAFDSQLGGALVIDPVGSQQADRIFVMTEWDARDRRVDDSAQPAARVFAINGQSWPYTERLTETIGASVRWRWVNLTLVGHPMHLHGFYFTVVSSGDGLRDNTYATDDYRQEVTERMPVSATMQMVWTPEREGNWLLHCHIIAHMTPALRFWQAASDDHQNHAAQDPAAGMAGLVLGITVRGDTSLTPAPVLSPARAMTLVMHRRAAFWHPEDAYAFALEDGQGRSAPDDAAVPGPALILRRGQPVEITLRNELPEATAVHWHGIELESYYDGVPGFSGSSGSTTPAIEPGASLMIHFTPPRAGTFIYHTHSHDDRQLASGLYGAIVVLEPGVAYDAAVDHLVVIGMQGAKNTENYERFPVVVNGSTTARMSFTAGVPNRIRVINITSNFNGLAVSLVSNAGTAEWRPIAKDGATLPERRQQLTKADKQTVGVGETYDFEVTPTGSQLWLEVRRADGEWVQQVPISIAR